MEPAPLNDDQKKAEILSSWINKVIRLHGINEARRVWNACTYRERPTPPPLSSTPPKPQGWLK